MFLGRFWGIYGRLSKLTSFIKKLKYAFKLFKDVNVERAKGEKKNGSGTDAPPNKVMKMKEKKTSETANVKIFVT